MLNEKDFSMKTQLYICQRVFNLPDLTMRRFYEWRCHNNIKLKPRWTQEVKDYIAAQIKNHTAREVAEMVKTEFNWPDMTAEKIQGALERYGIKTGRTGYFKKGMTTWNKGKKMSEELKAKVSKSWFPKGHKPASFQPIGSIRCDVDGYLRKKVGDCDWRLLHVLEWEKVHGPVPEGYCVTCLDGNRSNVALDNLALISRRENAILNHSKLRFKDPALTETGIKIARVKLAVKDKRKDHKCI